MAMDYIRASSCVQQGAIDRRSNYSKFNVEVNDIR
jgi:hypothetical protein